tara:strand:- start:191 stop:421 length:231 start_codon:yes stop_codon:yes gene_type:complete
MKQFSKEEIYDLELEIMFWKDEALKLKKANKELNKQLILPVVSICLERAKKYARHQHSLGLRKKDMVSFESWKAKD